MPSTFTLHYPHSIVDQPYSLSHKPKSINASVPGSGPMTTMPPWTMKINSSIAHWQGIPGWPFGWAC
ncbi:hypothetical protein BD309DRAFT_867305 [Dichomitus squalens]|uniref:Uncharacterized protein n=1 Tax=Dichomitus squalens TaxID=114155 RepID=A0A4Q9NMX4_9APHY|nr:hypothetical protein BD311DRAFT_657653 [Dichomitus squalens]TBU41957.1 hypothetical protein BD309DRAFT_867305 [Dichomitus squalens]TBU59637.1 hypothetical protein BD310DRAFT_817084 [Dichomitus squalens]